MSEGARLLHPVLLEPIELLAAPARRATLGRLMMVLLTLALVFLG